MSATPYREDGPDYEGQEPEDGSTPSCPECGRKMRQSPSGCWDFPVWLGCDQCHIAGIGKDQHSAREMMLHFMEKPAETD